MLRDVLLIGLASAACWPVSACECQASFGACKEVRISDLIFVGTVQSIQPIFLNRWYGTKQSAMEPLNDAFKNAHDHPSSNSLRQVKDAYLAAFPQLDDREKKQAQMAVSIQEITSLFDSSLDRGSRIHFKVKSIYKQEDDDDDAKPDGSKKAGGNRQKDDDDDQSTPDVLDVWTTGGDCGYDFQLGETYLVYADDEEGENYFFTSSCTRTKRLSEAGEDLTYLYFYKDQPDESSRIEGFATSDWKSQLATDPMHEPTAIRAPVSGVILELRSDRFARYSESDRNGRFIFDGLPAGTYQLSAFGAGYPMTNKLLSAPRQLSIKEKSCVRQIFALNPGN